MDVLTLIWGKTVHFFGIIVVVTVLIAFVVMIIERCSLARKVAKAGKAEQDGRGSGRGTKRHVAIITGASSGLGANYARLIAARPEKYGIDELWLVARRRERLEKLAQELPAASRVMALDLTREEDVERFRHALKKAAGSEAAEAENAAGFTVSILMNCAGFGRYGTSAEIGHEVENRMIDINDKAAISLTDLCLPYMEAGARIVQVCSVAALQPIPTFNAYAASKALLYSYSRGLHIELLPRGISVTAGGPYWIHEPEFIEGASGEKKKPFFSTTSKKVARRSLYDMQHHHALSTPGLICTLDRIFAGLIPDELLGYLMTRFL